MYIAESDNAVEAISYLRERFTAAGIPHEIGSVTVDDSDWNENWKKYFKAFEIGEKLAVCPSWENYPNTDNRTVISLDPGAAFGTGSHATTSLCLEVLERYTTPVSDLLDIGTGSGILGIAATLLGAIGDPKAIPALIETLKDNNKLVRREASTSLSRMGEPAVDPLIETLNDEDWRVRGAAAWALGNLGDEKAIPELEKLLDDESGYVKSGAESAIKSIKK